MSGPGDGDEHPWPRPEAPAAPERADAADEETRAERRAARAARVRRRRRVVAAISGALLVVVLAFLLWYELESHALGPEGPQVVVTVHQGESTDAIIDALSQRGVIGSSLAFQVSEVVHGTPTILPGSYALHENITFAQLRSALVAGPNVYPVNVRNGFTLSEVASQVDSLPGHAPGGFAKAAASGAVHSAFSPPGSNDLEGMLGTGVYLILPGESDQTIVQDMVQRFDHDATAGGLSTAAAQALGLTPYQLIDVASVVEKEGYIPVNMPDVARVIYNRLAQDQPAPDGLDRPLRARPGRRAGDVEGPADPVALQHLPEQGAAADAHLHAVAGRAGGRAAPAAGGVAVLRPRPEERRHGVLRHLRAAVGQRAVGPVAWAPLSRGHSGGRRRP